MTNATIDNKLTNEIGAVVLWQYDQAPHLLGILQMLQSFHDSASKEFWNLWATKLNIDTMDEFTASLFGKIIGCGWPSNLYGSPETWNKISFELYKILLRATFILQHSDYSISDLSKFVSSVYGPYAKVEDNYNMGITYSYIGDEIEAETELEENQKELAYDSIIDNGVNSTFKPPYPAAVKTNTYVRETVFCFEGQAPTALTQPLQGCFEYVGDDVDMRSHFINPYTENHT